MARHKDNLPVRVDLRAQRRGRSAIEYLEARLYRYAVRSLCEW